MRRPRFDQAAGRELAQTVRELEHRTDAQLVVVVRGRSGTYRHTDYLCGAIAAFAGLLFALYSPLVIPVHWIPLDVVVLFAAAAFVCSRSGALRRWLTSRAFRAAAVRTAAAARFYDAGIASTRAEVGLLVYLSLFERQLEVIADHGILKAVPPLEWNHAVSELHEVGCDPSPASLLRALRDLGALLAEHLPATPAFVHELDEIPRIELK